MTRPVLICILTTGLGIAGCNELVGDAIWTDKRTVIGATTSDSCVIESLKNLQNITVDTAHSQPGDIVLKLKSEALSHVSCNIRRQNPNVIDVFCVGKGTREPDVTRAMLAPILESITNSIERKCRRKD